MKYIIGIDQSTQGTKAMLFDGDGAIVYRADVPHRQIVNEKGWVSHDPEEIYRNVIRAVKMAVEGAAVPKEQLAAVGISNQRETTVLWDEQGRPLNHAVVWQCNRAETVVERLKDNGETVYERSGIPLSAYFPAAKMAWLMENVVSGLSGDTKLHFGTVDSWLLFKLTKNHLYKTDYSNASRTQLFNLRTLTWDSELCTLFGVPMEALPEVCDSNSCFGTTDFEGFLEKEIPILSMLGDSHGALFGQGCHESGMVKATYGTGSSVMMNIGESFVQSKNGLAASLAWGIDGKATYVLEGNINYTGAVITWLKEDVGLISSPGETEKLALQANPADTCILVPAFTGLSAPYWKGDAKAVLAEMSRTTGRAEIVRAALDSIAFQVTDVLKAMEQDSGCGLQELRTDGGPTKNQYLMQMQSDLANVRVSAAGQEELSAIGAAYLAGLTAGIYRRESLFSRMEYRTYAPEMSEENRAAKYAAWKKAVSMTF
ncbi:MAG: glycerol kinase GlpK [Lachnospiraceae bacterium]|nr:glycerol kinase [uncultured Acetatifactor sp.]MCI8286217.1 glycerol kinase GlpK [Lachnospiraceae bacterium]